MKRFTKRSLAWLASLMLLVSVFASLIVVPADAATVDYVYSGNYVYNWGQRETLATFLSPMAEDFYADNNVTYAQLAALSGSSTLSSVPNSALYEELHGLMYDNLTNPTSYAGTRDLYRYTDCQNSAITDNSISSFYSGDAIGPDWDSGSTWNREHVWPNSKSTSGSSYTDREEDIMMLRPTSVEENSSRSNTPYGESDGYYHPNEESGGTYDVRGDAARVVLYVYVCWGGSDSHDGALDNIWNVFESKDVLLKWIEEDPVDTWELGRNDSVESITGTRNVFVDYPELAFLLFDEEVPAGYDSPSGGEESGGCAHNYVSSVTTAATCDKDGVMVHTCSLCGVSYTEVIPATGHHIVNGVCSVCGTKKQDVTFTLGADGDASHKDGASATTYTETVDGYTLNIVSGVKMYTGAIDAQGNGCIKLGTGSAVGSFSFTVPNEVSSVVICIAQYKENATKIQVGDTAYTISGKSNDGQYDDIVVDTSVNKTVSLTTVSGGTRAMVNAIKYVVAAACEHVYDNACDADCNACGGVRIPDDHDYNAVVTAPDCENGGYTTYTCTVCGDTYVGDYVDALGHTEVIDEAVAPTCTATGLTEGKHCSACGKVLIAQTAVDVVDHDYDAVITAPDCENGGYTTYTCTACGDSYMDDEVDALGHQYDNACDADCNTCGAIREVGGHVYDDSDDTSCNECGAIRQLAKKLLAYAGSSISEDVNGLAFLFNAYVCDCKVENGNMYVMNSASVVPYTSGESYKVVRMGAVVSNQADAVLELDNVDNASVINIEAKHLWGWRSDVVSFAIRIIDIPEKGKDTVVTARPYYVYEVDGEEVVVYGDSVSKSYNTAAQ